MFFQAILFFSLQGIMFASCTLFKIIYGVSIGLLWLELKWKMSHVVCPKICITNPNMYGTYWMKQMTLHPKRLQKTFQIGMICAMSIGSNYRGERLIVSSMVTWTPKRDNHAKLVTRRNFVHDICLRAFEMF